MPKRFSNTRRRPGRLGRITIWVMAVLVVMTTVVFFSNRPRSGMVSISKAWTISPAPVLLRVSPVVPHNTYSREEIRQFYNLHLKKVIEDGVLRARYSSVSAINTRELVLEALRSSIRGKNVDLRIADYYSSDDPQAVMGANYRLRPVLIVILMPKVMDIYKEELGRSPVEFASQRFESTMVISMMHELEHLAGDPERPDPPTREWFINTEAKAWAETCRYSISAFLSLGYPLVPSDQRYFAGWVSCGKENNTCWRSFISNAYSDNKSYK